MEVTRYLPHDFLEEYVEAFLHLKADSNENRELVQTMLPSNQVFLMFELSTGSFIKRPNSAEFVKPFRSTIVSPQLFNTSLKGGINALIVVFKPSGFYRLFKIPINLFNNECLNGNDVLGNEYADLTDSLQQLKNLNSIIYFLELFLLRKRTGALEILPVDKAIEQLFLNKGNVPIVKLASDSCLSIRQLQRKCMERYGLSPKYYAKMIRYTHAIKLKLFCPHLTWSEIASNCGYFDQMHLIHDIKTITNLNPSDLSPDILSANITLVYSNG